MKKVYLGGPIYGLTFEQADTWRFDAKEELEPEVGVLNPLRNGYFDTKVPMAYKFRRDYQDVLNSDAGLFNLRGIDPEKMSIGTSIEIGWYFQLNKPVIFMINNNFLSHPRLAFLNCAILTNPFSCIVEDGLVKACELIKEWLK